MLLLLVVFAASNLLTAEDRIVVSKNRADEPLAKTFVDQKSIAFIERSVSRWQTRRKCISRFRNSRSGSYKTATTSTARAMRTKIPISGLAPLGSTSRTPRRMR